MAISSTNSLSSGMRVKLHALQRHPRLNGRIGTILRSPSDSTNRYVVYLVDPPQIVRTHAKNLAPHSHAPQVPHNKIPSRHALKLNTFLLSSLPGVGLHHLFYPFGNTAPTYVFPAIPSDAKQVRILLLACGDLRSPFYSLSRDTPARLACERNVHFFVNDFSPEIIARNLVILWLIHRSSSTVETIFAIWFSLRISATAYCSLIDAILALTAPNADAELGKINTSFHDPGDWHTVQGILKNWMSWQDQLAWDFVMQMRREAISRFANQSVEKLADSTALLLPCLYKTVGGDRQFPIEAGQAEVRQYQRTGVIQVAETPEFTNPTLFQRPDRYSLHYGSDPFSAFPRYATTYDPDKPGLRHCLQQMAEWIKSLREHGDNISWTFSTRDCMVLCTQLSGPFDVVSTSNVSDHVGLMPLLQALRGITTPSGTLLTQTLRFSSYSSSIEEYLQKNLIVGPEFYDSMLGWRCVGHDGNLTPIDGGVLFSVPRHAEVVLSSIARKHNEVGTRCELSLIWKPSRASNAPLCLSGNRNAQKLVKEVLPKVYSLPFTSEKACKTQPGWSLRTSLSILPVLLSAEGTERLLSSEDENAVELRDLAVCIKEGRLSEMRVATVQVSQGHLYEFFNTWKQLGSELSLYLIISRGNCSLPYCSISSEFDASSSTWLLSWLIHRDRLGHQDRVSLQAFCIQVLSFKFEDVMLKEAKREDYSAWLQRILCSRDASLYSGRFEDAETFTVQIKISDAWMKKLNSRILLQARIIADTGSLKVGAGEKLTHPVVIVLPGPIEASDTKLIVSRKQRKVKCVVKRGKYKISSLLLADSWIGDKDAWIPMKKENESDLMKVSGMQMSDDEKYVSRSRDIAPPLIALKDTFMFFFQSHQESYMTISFRSRSSSADVRGLIAHHGIRQEHRTGIPVADLSVCFLELSFLHEVVPWFQSVECDRHIYCTQEELDLMKQYCNLFSSRCKDRTSWDEEPLKAPIPPRIRCRFNRILVQPLFSPSLVTAFFNLIDGLGKSESDGSAQSLKHIGTRFCKDGNYTKAIPLFRRAIMELKRETDLDGNLSEGSKKLMVLCFLNLAYCNLQEGEVRDPEETITSCDRAMEHINPHDHALMAKARFRKGLALELLGKLGEAYVEFRAATRRSNDKAVVDAFQRVQENLKAEK